MREIEGLSLEMAVLPLIREEKELENKGGGDNGGPQLSKQSVQQSVQSFNVNNAKTMLKRLENLEKTQKSSIKLEAAIYNWYAKEFERITKNYFISYQYSAGLSSLPVAEQHEISLHNLMPINKNYDGNTLSGAFIRHTEILEELMIALSDKVNRLKIDLKEIQKERVKWLKYILKLDFYNHRVKLLKIKEIKKLEEKKKEKERYLRLIKISKNIIIKLNKIKSIVPKQWEAIKNKLSKILFKKLSKKLKRVDDKKIRLAEALAETLVAERPRLCPRKTKTKSISKGKRQRDYTVEKKKIITARRLEKKELKKLRKKLEKARSKVLTKSQVLKLRQLEKIKKIIEAKREKEKKQKEKAIKRKFLHTFVCNLMSSGKKSTAIRILMKSFVRMARRRRISPIKIFMRAVDDVKPYFSVRARRVGGSTFQIPYIIKDHRRRALAITWIIQAATMKKKKFPKKKLHRFLVEEVLESLVPRERQKPLLSIKNDNANKNKASVARLSKNDDKKNNVNAKHQLRTTSKHPNRNSTYANS